MSILKGNTIRFTAEFYDWDDVLTNPDSVILNIYNDRMEKISTIQPNITETGKYYGLYTASDVGVYIVEWIGNIGNYPSVSRKKITITTM
jgi:hypothetical protein